jgi:hypothetical protein
MPDQLTGQTGTLRLGRRTARWLVEGEAYARDVALSADRSIRSAGNVQERFPLGLSAPRHHP